MFRAGLLSALLLLSILPSVSGATAAEAVTDELSLGRGTLCDLQDLHVAVSVCPEDLRYDLATSSDGSDASDPPDSRTPTETPPSSEDEDDYWTVVVIRTPTVLPTLKPLDGAMPEARTLLHPLASRVRDVQGSTQDLPTEELLALLLGTEEEESEPATQTAAVETAPPIPTAVLVAGAATAATAAVFFFSGSTGAAGAAGAGATGSSAAGRKIPTTFSPLFTRFEGKKVLEHPNRAELYRLTATHPGIRLQDLCEETHLSRTAVTHHMRLLEQQHVVVSRKVGRSRHFYENGGRFEREQKDAYAVLQNDRSRAIARFIQEHPGSIQKEVCEALDVRASIAHWHVKRLEEAQLVAPVRRGRTVSYFPADAMAEVAL